MGLKGRIRRALSPVPERTNRVLQILGAGVCGRTSMMAREWSGPIAQHPQVESPIARAGVRDVSARFYQPQFGGLHLPISMFECVSIVRVLLAPSSTPPF